MKKKRITAVVVGFAIIFGVLGFFLLKDLMLPEKVQTLRLGTLPDAICALLYIAEQQGMFKRNGLDIVFDENYQGGLYAVEGLLAGKVDVATATEFVLAVQSFRKDRLRAIGTVCSSHNTEMIARRDHGIAKPEDLRGKRVGVSKGTIGEFLLHAFLSSNDLRPNEIQPVYLKPAEIVTALSEGAIDAAVCYPPFWDTIKKNLGDKAVLWSVQGGQDFYYLLITTDELIRTRSHSFHAFLKGLLEAETFLRKHEREAQDIVTRKLNLDRQALFNNWSKTNFRVRLDQDLLTLMEDEARWAIRNKLVDAEKVPNYLNFLYLDGLKKIKPEAVGVIH